MTHASLSYYYYGHSLCNAIQVCMPPQGSAGTIYWLHPLQANMHAMQHTGSQPIDLSTHFSGPCSSVRRSSGNLVENGSRYSSCSSRNPRCAVRSHVQHYNYMLFRSHHYFLNSTHTCQSVSLSCRKCCFHAPLHNPYVCIYILNCINYYYSRSQIKICILYKSIQYLMYVFSICD